MAKHDEIYKVIVTKGDEVRELTVDDDNEAQFLKAVYLLGGWDVRFELYDPEVTETMLKPWEESR